ncbi:zinc-ribbon domain-containing protein [Gemmatimonas sp.]|uniref:zinc-ribbon domain-containing protein n=1 Tax=Gemmatimonas sp. TaxID=1962908 RepID=UPI00333F8BCD
MTVSCPECRSVFRVDPAKVPATGVRARCSVCGGVIAIAGGTLPVSVTPVAASTAVPAFAGGTSRATPGLPSAAPAVRQPTPIRQPALSVPTPARSAPAMPTPARPMDTVPRMPTPAAVPRMPTPVAMPSVSFGVRPTPALPTAPVSAAGPSVMVTSPTPYPVPTMATPAAGTPAEGKKPINPFLQADPSQRARRLARALVSDLVAYNPQKREEGIREGTLRGLFREEIKKSYEEYVEQVGREAAESAPHFQEALNDILAGGRRLF